jgi:hypothetical protein
MKQVRINSRFIFPLIGLMAFLVSCQLGSVRLPTAVSSTPSTAKSTAQSGGQTQTTDELSLSDPMIGLAALKSYHLNYSNTTKGSQKGQTFESSLTIERRVNGADESELVQQISTGIQPVYLVRVETAGARYTQQKAGGPCQAAVSGKMESSVQTVKLPPVFGAKRVGSETLNNIAAIHYQFDEKSVQRQAGQKGKAQGDVWIAQQGGTVLKYELTIQLPSGDFQGTRTWSYQLSNIESGPQINLPQGCLPLITDIPMMGGAAGVVQRPGFLKYIVSASLDQMTQFYVKRLTAVGWSLLPGIEPANGKQTLVFIKDRAEGGSQFAVIQISEENGQTLAILQSATTQKAIVIDPTPGPGTGGPEIPIETPEPGDEVQTPEAGINLPADLPKYPGASATIKTDQMIVLKTNDTPQKVIAFYKQGMEESGYTLDNSLTMNGVTSQTWIRDQLQIIVIVTQQENRTQIVISALKN